MSDERLTRIETLLREAFAPSKLLIKDQSHLHAGHAGAKDGRGHYDVTIVAEAFAGKSPIARHRMEGQNRIQRHRMVYDALTQLLATDIHALRIKASAPAKD